MPVISGTSGGTGAEALLTSQILGVNGFFDITNIPQTYNHLKFIVIARGAQGSASDTLYMQFNADASAIYYTDQGKFSGVTASGTENLATTLARINPTMPASTGSLASSFSVNVVWIPGYASTTRIKSWVATCHGTATTGTGNVVPAISGGTWNSTAAITEVAFAGLATSNLVTGSALYMYGVT